ncbi:[FeFe] hydrogenase H-cluster radical SAM maturase HydG [Sedimentisphaera salicampi]|uniref:2-iminoacetate synthase n=1 Tax=Sedimentisphaera salicampi TaxID=1941349 RepID=A0A1W6LIM0_9BACT|nr:[FeFe] hydrogenase H-cluster radical SAM maturase HydG [Sedimentisphaera salicampi]ARN55648.1 2-iminoacetate synthase [Sedimentisphaera salicampi]
MDTKSWIENRIKQDEIDKYLENGEDFINTEEIESVLAGAEGKEPEPARVREIIAKSLNVENLTPQETAELLNVTDPDMLAEMQEAALKVKKKVYDNRIVTFAPLYMSNLCVNNCSYCGFRTENEQSSRRALSMEEVKKEAEVLAGKIGHKRLIVVYGEHPSTDVDYVADTINTVYSAKMPTKKGYGSIRRVNVNMAPIQIDELKYLRDVGIGTYQVFQETYHKPTYAKVHPANTIKGNYRWRLYCMHRALEAGVDDVGIGALFGLYDDWKFEVMGLLYHSIELEDKFGIGPHTISFPRIEPAVNTPYVSQCKGVSNDDFERLVTVVRLAVPHTGLIITCREDAEFKDKCLSYGCTQTDASSQIGIGGYAELAESAQEEIRQQFVLGDTRSLDTMIGDYAEKGMITSFCTAGYRCGRTGKCIMNLLKSGEEGKFCKLNAVITFREWLDDFAGERTKQLGEKVIQKEIREIKEQSPEKVYQQFMSNYERTLNGERDIYF